MTSMLYVLELIDVVICESLRNGRCLEVAWLVYVLVRKEMYIGISQDIHPLLCPDSQLDIAIHVSTFHIA
jgi:hypothetical protein